MIGELEAESSAYCNSLIEGLLDHGRHPVELQHVQGFSLQPHICPSSPLMFCSPLRERLRRRNGREIVTILRISCKGDSVWEQVQSLPEKEDQGEVQSP